MNVYDFDGTIYPGDSTVEFYLYCLVRHPGLIRCLPRQLGGTWAYLLGRCGKTRWKEAFFCFLPELRDLRAEVRGFWDRRGRNIREWYLRQKQVDDVVISASPEFLLQEICQRLEIRHLIASEVDEQGGFSGENCYGEQKTARFRQRFPEGAVDRFYSDSLSDWPMARLAAAAYLVNGTQISRWPLDKQGKY